ncbi:MAG: outer membrane protein assembly factor BamA [Deltaproteobacteria bacterium]|nr:outer membrane protein assembly factor BamA [Deltaproteobacteria bacterium]
MNKKVFFFICALLVFSSRSQGAETLVHSITLRNHTAVSDETIRSILPLKEGETWDEEKFKQAIAYLKQWGRFRKVEAEKKISQLGVDLVFNLDDGWIISNIDVRGHYPFLSRRIRAVISLRVGTSYREGMAEEQIERIEHFFEGQGYEGTKVFVEEKKDPKKDIVLLTFKVKKGRRFRIGNITVDGNTVFPHSYFVSKVNPLIPYRLPRLKESLDKIRRDYQEKGYLRARIKLARTERDEKENKIHLWLKVDQHDQVSIQIRGNRKLMKKTLLPVLTLKQDGGYDRYEIEQSRQALLRLYAQNGFMDARVEAHREEIKSGKIKVIFSIVEGVRTQVHSIRFVGNKNIGSGKLKENMGTKEAAFFHWAPFEPHLFERDLRQFTSVYGEQGYLEASVIEKKVDFDEVKDHVFIEISLEEGQRSFIDEIQFEGHQHFSERKLKRLITHKKRRPLKPQKIAEDREKILAAYAKDGFPYATVLVDPQYDKETAHVSLRYVIDEGKRVKVGQILIVGNNHTWDRSVRSALSLKEGSLFDQSKVLESAASLRKLGAFNSVNIEVMGLEQKESIVHLLVKLEEAKPAVIDLATSFDTIERFSGEVTFTHRNLFGLAKRGNISFKGGEKIQRGEFNLINPRFFGSNLQFITTGFSQLEDKPAFNAFELGGILSLLREFTSEISLLGRYEFTRTSITDSDPTDTTAKRDNSISKVGVSFTYDSRDYFADPKNGFFFLSGNDVATTVLGSGSSFLKFRGWFGHYKTFFGVLTFANTLRMEGIKNVGQESVPIQELLFVGGDYSVRGFAQDSIGPKKADGTPEGGQISVVHNIEMQTKLFHNIKGVLFLDSGSLTNDVNTISLDTLRHGAGAGLRYITPVGPIRFDYGFKLDQRSGEGEGRFHFSFGTTF